MPDGVPTWRWIALSAVLVAVAHHWMRAQAGGLTLEALLARTPGALAPAHPVFAAWSVILLALLGNAMYQLAGDQHRVSLHDRVSRPVSAIAALSCLQVLLLEPAGVHAAAVLSIAIAIAAAIAYERAQREIAEGRAHRRLAIALSATVAHAGVMAIASVSGALATLGWTSATPRVLMIVAAGAAAIRCGLVHRDAVAPAVVAWAVTSLCAGNPSTGIVGAALIAGSLCTALAIVIAATRAASRPLGRPATR